MEPTKKTNYIAVYEGNHNKANRHYLATKMVKSENSETLKQTYKRNPHVVQSEIPNWIMVTWKHYEKGQSHSEIPDSIIVSTI